MHESPLRLIKQCAEYQPIAQIENMPVRRRGVYVLYKKRRGLDEYSVVYIGMATRNIRRRLVRHRAQKATFWTLGHMARCGTNIGRIRTNVYHREGVCGPASRSCDLVEESATATTTIE